MPSPGDIIIIAVVCAVLFAGPERLARWGGQLGAWARRGATDEDPRPDDDEDDEEWSADEVVPLLLLIVLVPITAWVWLR
jgi:Sec-independent protein translocase protein TatA